MSWLDRFRKPKVEVFSQDIPVTTVYRWYLYDAALHEDVNMLAELIGLTPVSEEGHEKEKQESEKRLEALIPFMSFIQTIADASATSMTALHMGRVSESMGEHPTDLEQTAEDAHAVFEAIAASTLIGAFSIALDLGLITSRLVSTKTMDAEGFDDNE